MKRRGSFLAKATGTLLTLGFCTAFNFIVNLVLSRVLGPAGKGITTPALSVATIGIAIAALGLDNSAAYFLDRKQFRAKDVLLTAMLFAVISAALAFVGIRLALDFVIPEATPLTRLFFAGGAFFTVIYTVAHSGLLGRNRIGLINIARLAADLVRTVLATLFLYSLWPSVEGFAFAYMVAQALNTLLTLIFAFSEVGMRGAKVDFGFLTRAIGFGIPVFFAALTLQTNRQIGILILKSLTDAEKTGIYAQALTFANLLLLVPKALSFALYGAVVGESGKEEFTARTVRLSLLFVFIAAVITAALAPWLIPLLFTEKFAASVPYLWGLLPSVVIYTLPQLYASFVIASWGKPWHVFAASLIGVALNAAGNLLLVPRIGAWGTVISFNAASLAMAVYYIALIKMKGQMSLGQILIPRADDFRRLVPRSKLRN